MTATTGKRRRTDPEGRRRAVLDAALVVFAAEGFAGAKLDDVAVEAGVAKGTIYLYFRDKQDLFEQVVRGAIAPVLERLEDLARRPDVPIDAFFAGLFEVFQTEMLGTRRKEIMRLVIVEGARFPGIAEFYHREVISKGMEMIREMARRAHAAGELSSESLVNFPQLVFAPLLMSVIWDGLFSRFDPLDVEGLFAAHRDILVGGLAPQGKRS